MSDINERLDDPSLVEIYIRHVLKLRTVLPPEDMASIGAACLSLIDAEVELERLRADKHHLECVIEIQDAEIERLMRVYKINFESVARDNERMEAEIERLQAKIKDLKAALAQKWETA